MQKLVFEKPLLKGIIKSRPNRFIFNVLINGIVEKCHCPSTGQIASISFDEIPCLLSESDNKDRKTKYTVEAISLDKKNYIGINQTKANHYVEFFIKTGQLSKIFTKVNEIKREVKFANSRIDFKINDKDYLEVKTPLKDIPSENHPNYLKRKTEFISFDRLIKHFTDISKSINKGSRAIFLMCYIYDAKRFSIPKENKNEEIVTAAKKATLAGVENWQINLKIDSEGVSLLDYFKLNLF